MPDDHFETECDRLSSTVDSVQFERVRWAKHEGPMLERLVELAHAALGERSDFELTDEGSKGPVKRFVLKVHGARIVAVNLGLEGGSAVVWADAIERSQYRIVDGRRHAADYHQVDEAWMKRALGAVIGEVQ